MIMVLATGSDAKSKLKFWIDILRHFLAKIIQKIRFYLVIQCLASSCSILTHRKKKLIYNIIPPLMINLGNILMCILNGYSIITLMQHAYQKHL